MALGYNRAAPTRLAKQLPEKYAECLHNKARRGSSLATGQACERFNRPAIIWKHEPEGGVKKCNSLCEPLNSAARPRNLCDDFLRTRFSRLFRSASWQA